MWKPQCKLAHFKLKKQLEYYFNFNFNFKIQNYQNKIKRNGAQLNGINPIKNANKGMESNLEIFVRYK